MACLSPPLQQYANDRKYGSCTQIDVAQVEHRCNNPKCRKLFFKGKVSAVEVKCPYCNAFNYFTEKGGFA